ncbi:MAG: hypothetical protein H6641_18025 [Caldilineaceae bacterium]|nr:hypothetical protein [Caldilineaceae bacterium]
MAVVRRTWRGHCQPAQPGHHNSAMFVVVPDLLDYLRVPSAPTLPCPMTDALTRSNAPLLILTTWAPKAPHPGRAKSFQLLNHRCNAAAHGDYHQRPLRQKLNPGCCACWTSTAVASA